MAFFKNFQQHLPSVSSLVGTISSVVEDLTTAVGDVSCALTDSVAEQVTSMINGFRPEEENSAAEEVIDNSKQKNAMLPEVTKDANCQKTQSSSEHRAKQINCFTSFSQKHEAMHEEGVLERVNCRQQTLSKYQETSNADDSSLKGHVGNGTSALKQSTWAGSPCQALESTDRCKITNSKDRLHGKIKEQINPAKYYKVKGPTKTKKNEAIWAKKGTAQSKDEKYSKIIPEKDNSYMDQDEHGSSSESEDEALGRYHEALSRTHNSRLPLADSRQKSYAWETRQKYSPLSAEYDGYSSEASIDEGNCIQRMRRTPPLDELQPPPYQDDSGSPHLSCTPSEIGDNKCEHSHCSNSPRCSYNKCPSEGSTGHEVESFHNKGYEEDVPSDSTAVLSPEYLQRQLDFCQLLGCLLS